MPTRAAQTVVVSTLNGTDIKGILREHTDEHMVLSNAAVAGVVGDRTVWQKLAGETVIPMSRVDYWQRKIPAEFLSELTEEA